jgi:hypothetical protein
MISAMEFDEVAEVEREAAPWLASDNAGSAESQPVPASMVSSATGTTRLPH